MSDLPRLLFCCFDVVPGPSAISRRLTEYVRGLSERFQVVVLSVKTPDHPHIERYHGARLLRVPVGNGDLAARAQVFDRAVRRQLESEEYVLVHFFDPFGGYALAEKHTELGYKLVYDACSFTSMDFAADEIEASRKLLAKVRRQELFCLMNADAIIVGNPLTRDWVSSVGVEREHVHLLPAPVDLGPYKPETMGEPDAPTMRVVHLGSLAPAHGLAVLLDGVNEARASAPMTLTLIGPPNPAARARLEEQISKLGLTGVVEFQPPVPHDDVHKVLAAADVGLVTLEDSERNRVVGSPLSRLPEYLAAGRPVIAADVASARQLVPEEAAVWYRPQEARSLADALVSLATDPARRNRLGKAARAAAARWDAVLVRADLLSIYANLTGQPAVRVGGELGDANEPTQLGRSAVAAESGDVTQLGARPFDPTPRPAEVEPVKAEADSGTNKVKTDPAVVTHEGPTDSGAIGDRPPVMGVPLRDELPPVVEGVELTSEAPPAAAATTPITVIPLLEIDAPRSAHAPTEPDETPPPASVPDRPPPPLPGPPEKPSARPTLPSAEVRAFAQAPEPSWADEIAHDFVPGLELDELRTSPPVPSPPGPSAPPRSPPTVPVVATVEEPAPTPLPAPPPDDPLSRPLRVIASLPDPTSEGPAPRVLVSAPPPGPRPLFTPAPFPIAPLTLPPISAPAPSSAPAVAAPRPAEPTEVEVEIEVADDEVLEVSDDEVELVEGEAAEGEEAELAADEAVEAVETDASPPPSAIDPWLAQLVHGYCPPGSHLFDRHVPPTTMPGRDT